MSDLSAEIQLRPTRIGFLVHPADLASVRRIMRACACLWGGVYNPIIPVFNKPPTEWKSEVYERFKGAAIAKGYVRFFEPDVYVEAEAGLLEKVGLGALRQDHSFHSQVITLKELFQPQDGRSYSEPEFGLNVHDVLGQIYNTEQKFVLRDKREGILVKPQRGKLQYRFCVCDSLSYEILFGRLSRDFPIVSARASIINVGEEDSYLLYDLSNAGYIDKSRARINHPHDFQLIIIFN